MRVFAITLLAALAGVSAPANVQAGGAMERGRTLFTVEATPPCSVCHTLADAGSAGEIGPNLDELAPDAGRVKAAVSGGIGVMPAYGDLLVAADIDALAEYVSAAVNK